MFKFLLKFIPGWGPALSTAWGFITTGFQFVVKHWKFFSIAAMVGLIVYQNQAVSRFLFGLETIPHMRTVVVARDKEIVQLKTDLKTAVDGNAKLTSTIGELNTTVAEWQKTSKDLEKKIKDLQVRLDKMRKENDKKVQDILNGQTPESCEASIEYLRDQRLKLTW